MDVGTRIKEARLAVPLTREQMAPLIGVTLRTLARWENDESKNGPSMAAMYRIAEVTGKPLSFFVSEVAA